MRRFLFPALFLSFNILLLTSPVLAQSPNPGPAGILQLQEMIQRLINISITFAFIILTIVLFYGGTKFITSGGDPKAVAASWQVITWGLLGILFLALAWLILKLIQLFTGAPVTMFCLGLPGAPTACPGTYPSPTP